MATELVRTTLVITAHPSGYGGGSDWFVSERVEDGDGGHTTEPVTCGGTPRGPRGIGRSEWFAWARRQVTGATKYRIRWDNAEVTSGGYSDGLAEHGGIRITVPATRRVRR